jgi:hypothetical protein
MPLSHDVTLPRSQPPVFPHLCVSCLKPPETLLAVSTRSIGWWTLAFLTSGRRIQYDVPVCHSCLRRIRHERRLRFWANAAFILAGVLVAVLLLGRYHGPFRKHLACAIVLVCCLPLIFWETFRPPAIDLTVGPNSIDYEFRNKQYAEAFAASNGAIVT